MQAFEAAMSEAARHRAAGDSRGAFATLERAHVLGQLDFVPHVGVHWQMLRAGWSAGDRCEVAGRLMRIALVPVSDLVGRLPVGNTGGANVSTFEPMAIPPELERLIEDRDR
jgi:hypothetical protein